MVQLTIDIPEDVLSTLEKSPAEFTAEFRLAAAVKWYELGILSQGRAAEVAGLSRRDFIDSLSRFEVSPFQESAAEIMEEGQRE